MMINGWIYAVCVDNQIEYSVLKVSEVRSSKTNEKVFKVIMWILSASRDLQRVPISKDFNWHDMASGLFENDSKARS